MIKTLNTLDKGGSVLDLTNAETDYMLEVGETATITYTSATSVPLHVATSEGVYEMNMYGDQTVTIGTLNSVYLLPNNYIITDAANGSGTAGDIDDSSTYSYIPATSTSTAGVSNTSDGTSRTAFWLSAGILVSRIISVSTYTKSKGIIFHGIERHAASEYYRRDTAANWINTTVAWTSLGTITFPFAQSGKIVIRRII